MDDFYVDDEPVEKIQAIRARPPDFVTAEPASPRTQGLLDVLADAVVDIRADRPTAAER